MQKWLVQIGPKFWFIFTLANICYKNSFKISITIVGLLGKNIGKQVYPPNFDTFKLKKNKNLSVPPYLEHFE